MPVTLNPSSSSVPTVDPSAGASSALPGNTVDPTLASVATPISSTSAGLDAASAAHEAPQGSVAPTNMVGAGVSAVTARLSGALGRPGPGLLELRPGVVPDAVSLSTVLKGMAGTPDAQKAVQGIVAQLEGALGIKVPPALVAAAIANPERLSDLLALTPDEMKKGFDAMHAAHGARQAQGAAAPAGKPRHLPKKISLEAALQLPIARPKGDLKELSPGLWRGDVPSSIPDDQARRNLVLAEIFDRLGENPTAAPADRFTLSFLGHNVSTLPAFLKLLVDAGYTVEGEVAHRIADFAALKTKAPDGSILDVPAAVMVRTGFKDAQGSEAVLPAVHSEVVFHLRSGPNARGPKLDADLKWYQGVPNTGFFACDLMRKSTWTGTVVTDRFDQATAVHAAKLCANLSDLINDVSAAAGLAMNGYGVTGVCNDSVAVIQQALTGHITGYPLFMRDDVLSPELERRLHDGNRRDDAALRELKAAMAQAPSDEKANASAAARARASIPWVAGAEPFASTVQARAILSAF